MLFKPLRLPVTKGCPQGQRNALLHVVLTWPEAEQIVTALRQHTPTLHSAFYRGNVMKALGTATGGKQGAFAAILAFRGWLKHSFERLRSMRVDPGRVSGEGARIQSNPHLCNSVPFRNVSMTSDWKRTLT